MSESIPLLMFPDKLEAFVRATLLATGLVEGVRARTTPAGRGTSTMPRSVRTTGVTKSMSP